MLDQTNETNPNFYSRVFIRIRISIRIQVRSNERDTKKGSKSKGWTKPIKRSFFNIRRNTYMLPPVFKVLTFFYEIFKSDILKTLITYNFKSI